MITKTSQTESQNIVTAQQERYLPKLLLFLSILTGVRILILAFGAIDLSGDEAHYWEWSRHLDWCYYSKPPGTGFLIWLGTQLFGPTELGVRFMATILSFCAGVVMYLLGKRMYGPKAGFIAAILLQIMPLYSAFGIGLTPDSSLLLFWLLSLYFLHRAWSDGKAKDWLILSCTLGLGLLCKYAIGFFYPAAIMFLLVTPQGRKRLCTAWPYVSILGSLLFFTPVLMWNSKHNWVMFRHDLGHTHIKEGFVLSFKDFGNFLLGQFGVVTPIMCVWILYLIIRGRKQNPFCFWLSIPILAGFLLKSMQGKIQPNWPMTAWLVGLLPVADFLAHQYKSLSENMKRLLSAGLIIPAAAALFLHIPFLVTMIPFPEKANPLKKITGWRQLGKDISEIRQTMEEPCFLFSDYYMIASELAFYSSGHPTTWCVNFGRRMNQYDLWPGIENNLGQNAVFVSKNDFLQNLTPAFERVEQEQLTIRNQYGRKLQTYYIARCYGFKGMTAAKPASF